MDSYQAHLAELIDRYLGPFTNEASITPVLAALGARNVSYETTGWSFTATEPPPPESEALVRSTLLMVLRTPLYTSRMTFVTGVAAMDALLQNERWKVALCDMDGRYDLAELVMQFAGVFYGPLAIEYDVNTLKSAIGPALLTMLNDWLEPATPLTTYPSLSEITRLIFGDAWVSLVLESAGNQYDVWDLSLLMSEMRPQFAPGLIPGEMEPIAESLPNIEVSC